MKRKKLAGFANFCFMGLWGVYGFLGFIYIMNIMIYPQFVCFLGCLFYTCDLPNKIGLKGIDVYFSKLLMQIQHCHALKTSLVQLHL